MTVPTDLQEELAAAWADLEKAQQRLKDVRRRVPSEPVQDYELRGPDGARQTFRAVRRTSPT